MNGKTALLTGCYLEGTDPSGSSRFERMMRFVLWHWHDRSRLKFNSPIFLSDNGSSAWKSNLIGDVAYALSYQDTLIRGYGENAYPYCWRHLYTIKILIQLGYEKIIFIDSDCYVVSERLAKHIRELRSGWEAFWIEKYQFPSAEIHVLCKDAFPVYEKFTSVPYTEHVGKLMETALPFTNVNKDFKVDRYGEDRIPQEDWMDGYCQAPVSLRLRFVGE